MRAGTLVPVLFFGSYPHTKRWDSFLSTLAVDGRPRGGLGVVMGKQSVRLGVELSGQNTQGSLPLACAGLRRLLALPTDHILLLESVFGRSKIQLFRFQFFKTFLFYIGV